MTHHPVVKAGLELGAVSGVVSYWVGVLPSLLGLAVTTASLIYYILAIYYIRKNNR